ncbi:hypothetical protein ACFXJ8_00815 [Nonomuraea sp. NPDC059194]|uniref:hypothetical protein n=1 Tax=Nonomuraea sp. NPDC059194 TaxID=3346764 RepID=UPI0036C923F7
MVEIRSKEYPVRVPGADFDVHGDQPVEKVKNIIEGLDARGIEKAGAAYLNAGSMLVQVMKTIEDAAFAMAKIWGDKSSAEAQQSLRAIYITMKNLAGSCNQIGRQLESLGKTVIPAFRDYGGDYSWSEGPSWTHGIPDLWVNTKGDGGMWFASDNTAAKEHLKNFQKELKIIHDLLPATVREDLPDITQQHVPPPEIKIPTGGPKTPPFNPPTYDPYTGNAGPGNGGPSGGGNWPDGKYPDGKYPDDKYPEDKYPDGKYPDGKYPDGKYPDGTFPDGTRPKFPDFPGSGDGSQNPNVPPGGAGVNGPRVTTAGLDTPEKPQTDLASFQNPNYDNLPNNQSIDPRTGLPTTTGPNSGTSTSPSTSPSTGTSTGTSAGGAGGYGSVTQASAKGLNGSGMGMPMMPMGASPAAGQEEQKKEGSTWLLEEDSVWGGADDNAINPTLGQA